MAFREQRFYRYFGGVEFSNVNTHPLQSRSEAERIKELTIRDVKRAYPKFPIKGRVIKTRGGYWAMVNSTVRNFNEWERTGKLPKRR